ncbi:hypothetical protein [Vibrio metschnikovii]|uniref:hypothetical protein n=1 Tax=Vibrio metschnikovii TaxID=28172 RepID=UPI001C30B5E3|nr:hypothetical protein [Vibrio metschnikovii]
MHSYYLPQSAQNADNFFAGQPDVLAKFRQQHPQQTILLPNQPYALTCDIEAERLLTHFRRFSTGELEKLNQANHFLGDYLLPLARMKEELIDPVLNLNGDWTNYTNASFTAAGTRSHLFKTHLKRYEQALIDLHQAKQARMRNPHHQRSLIATKEVHARMAYNKLQTSFTTELDVYRTRLGKNAASSPLHNVERGINVAKDGRSHQGNTPGSRRTHQTLNVSNSGHIQSLHSLSRSIHVVGRGLVVLDGASRLNKVNDARKNNEDYARVFVTESAGLGAGIVIGGASAQITMTFALQGAARATAAGFLGINLLAGPVGWVVLIGSLAVTAYVSYQTSEWADKTTKDWSGKRYDIIKGAF